MGFDETVPAPEKSVLETDRYISTMMPCTFSVWEDDNGKIYLSRINMGLIAKMFGGNVAREEKKCYQGF